MMSLFGGGCAEVTMASGLGRDRRFLARSREGMSQGCVDFGIVGYVWMQDACSCVA
jgi:hypothetical protein